MARSLWCLMACVTLFGAGSLQAQAPTPLPRGSRIALVSGGDPLPQDLHNRIQHTLSEAVRAMGHAPLEPHAVRHRLAEVRQPRLCERLIECDKQALRQVLDVDAVLIYAVWLVGKTPREIAISVTRAPKSGHGSEGEASQLIEGQDLSSAVRRAVAQAIAATQRRRTVDVLIEAEPAGAEVSVGDSPSSRAPARFPLNPGRYQVRINKPGYVSLVDYIDVPAQPSTTTRRFQLEIRDASEAAAPNAPSYTDYTAPPRFDDAAFDHLGPRPSTWNYVIGTSLVLVGLPAIAYGIANVIQAGRCDSHDSRSDCVERVQINAITALAFAGGAVATLTGGAFLIVAPIDGPTSPRMSATVGYATTF